MTTKKNYAKMNYKLKQEAPKGAPEVKKEDKKMKRTKTAAAVTPQTIRISSLNHKINRKAMLFAELENWYSLYQYGAADIEKVEAAECFFLETLQAPIGAIVGRQAACPPVRDYHGQEWW